MEPPKASVSRCSLSTPGILCAWSQAVRTQPRRSRPGESSNTNKFVLLGKVAGPGQLVALTACPWPSVPCCSVGAQGRAHGGSCSELPFEVTGAERSG